jgi:hypothetical protein
MYSIIPFVVISSRATVATSVHAVRNDDLAQEVVIVDSRKMRKVGIGEVGSDVPFLWSHVGVE